MLNNLFGHRETDRRVNPVFVPLISDQHGGHSGALMSPDTVIEIEDENGSQYNYKPEMTERQKHLWNIYTDAIDKIAALANGAPLHPLHIGDWVMGNKYLSELVRPEISAQIQIAFDGILPLLRMPNVKTFRSTRGTGAHEFALGSASGIITQLLRIAFHEIDISSVQHGLATIGGVDIDYSHHGPTAGKRVWLRGNEARYYLRNCMMNDILQYGKPASVYVRGHVHVPVVEVLQVAGQWSTLVIVPSMMIGGEFVNQATQSEPRVSNGVMALEIEDGKVREIHDEWIHTQDLRTREALSA